MIPHPLPHLTNEEKLEIKRYSGQLSCAECRRLKVKCNRKVPCNSCVRRGCSKICPNGTMTANRVFRGPRTSDNAHLYRKIEEMSRRIMDLEVALSLLQARVSSEVHPLLDGDLVKIKYTSDISSPDNDSPMEESLNESPNGLENALGTLAIGEHGDSRYFGRSGGSETLFTAGEELDDAVQTVSDYPFPSPEIARLSNMFPLGEDGAWDVPRSLNMLISFLPPRPRASALCEVYLEQGCLTGRPIWRPELINDVVTPIYQHYKKVKDSDFDLEIPDNVTPHKIAVLYLVFCLGALMDLTIPAYSTEADSYFHMGRASLTLVPVFDSTEIWTVQALLIMSQIHTYGGSQFSIDKTWSLIALACKLAQKVGLHREISQLKLDTEMLQRRRILFWELFVLDSYFSLHTGRPPTIRLSYVDCQLPLIDYCEDPSQESEFPFHYWKYKFAKEVISAVTEATVTTVIPRYQTILDLDKKVREMTYAMGVATSSSCKTLDDLASPAQYVRLQSRLQLPAVTLIQIHRSFFAQALLEHPKDPLSSPYAASFLAAFQCASCIIASNVKYFSQFQELLLRWWSVWNTLFTSAILVGSIVVHSPHISMAPKALACLNSAVCLFEKGAAFSARARSGLVVLKRLQRRAVNAASTFQDGGMQTCTEDPLESFLSDLGDELKIFAGHTQVVVSKHTSNYKSKGSPLQNSPNIPFKNSPPSNQLPTTSGNDPQPDTAQSGNSTMKMPQQWPQMQFMPMESHNASREELPPSLYANQQYFSSEFVPNAMAEASERSAGPHPCMLGMDNRQCDTRQISPDQRLPYNYGSLTAEEFDLGIVGESGMDACWISFMLESGIVNGDVGALVDAPSTSNL